MADQDFREAAQRALDGRNDTLFLAIHDRLNRAPTTVEECEREIQAMTRSERVLYGAEDWSDNTKQFCSRCGSEHRGSSCPESDAMAREAQYGL